MDIIEWLIIWGFGALVIGTLAYAIARLWNTPRDGVDENSARFARFLGYPRFFDPLLAKPLTTREKLGWLAVLVIAICAIVFTTVTGSGTRQ